MSKEITVADVRHMAKLSRLAVTETEEQVFARQFAQIIEHINVLNKVDTTGIEPLYSPVVTDSSPRRDNACNMRTREEILANAPETDGQCFIVPRIV